MTNQLMEEWVQDASNYQDNLKIVMWKGVKIPVKNFLCPICNDPQAIEAMKMACRIDPECVHPETQVLIHAVHGWSKCQLAIENNVVYHRSCLEQKYGQHYDQMVKDGLILSED